MNNTIDEKKLEHIKFFYHLLDHLESKLGGKRILSECYGSMKWPRRGGYFFFQAGEVRSTSGQGLRVVRVGTHGLIKKSRMTLWKRLRQHRGSIFRLHVGTAFIEKNQWKEKGAKSWSIGSSAPSHVREDEYWIEKIVSEYISQMPFLWLKVGDPPGPESMRAFIEKNSVALLSNYPYVRTSKERIHCIDTPSKDWMGRSARSDKVRKSGLWNSNHTDGDYDPGFLDVLKKLI